MQLRIPIFAAIVILVLLPHALKAAESKTTVPLVYPKSGGGYYASVSSENLPPADFMVDTGSSYSVINEATFTALQVTKQVHYVKDISGKLANGSVITVPLYQLNSVDIGCCCRIRNVDVAVFPGSDRQILGLSALQKVAPFELSLEPPQLKLSKCEIVSF